MLDGWAKLYRDNKFTDIIQKSNKNDDFIRTIKKFNMGMQQIKI